MRRNKLSHSMNELAEDNQFIEAERDRDQGDGSYRSMSKDLRIQKLQERNYKLKSQVRKIDRALSSMEEEKSSYGIKLPEIKGDVVKKQLQNAYKMIKQYEYQIGKRKKNDYEGAFVQQVTRHEKNLTEKQGMSEKLRKEILDVKKLTVELTKMLKNQSLRKQYQEKNVKMNADIKWLHQKIKEMEAKKLIFNNNMEKQQELIAKLERELIKQEFSKGSLEQMRARHFAKSIQSVEDDIQDDLTFEKQIETVQEKTQQAYQNLINEAKLFKKLQKDNQLKINLMAKEAEEAGEANHKSRNRLLETEFEVEKIQIEIVELKKMINPKALRPHKVESLYPSRSENQIKSKIKIKPFMAHTFKYTEIGTCIKSNGKRFIDRQAIGKNFAKIVAIKFFQDTESFLIGFQATYLVGGNIKKGQANLLVDRKKAQIVETTFDLSQNDFFKTIDCLLSENDVIVGVSMVSCNNVVVKAGKMTAKRRTLPMEPNQYPICLYGCLLDKGLQLFGAELASQQ